MPKPWASAQGKTDAKVSFVHGLKGLCRTPNVVCMRESQAQPSPLCWVQTSSLTWGRARHYTMLIFYRNNHQKSSNEKKKKLQRLVKHYYYYKHHQGVFMYANNKVWLLPSIALHPAGGQHGFLFPPGKVQRKANLKSGEGKRVEKGKFSHRHRKRGSSKRFCFAWKGLWWLLKGHFSGKGPSSPRQNQHPQLRKIFFKQQYC